MIRGNQAYLPNIAASPTGPLQFNVDTQAFVNVIGGVNGGAERDASAAKFLNLHLGARDPRRARRSCSSPTPWAIGFTSQSGAGKAYVVSAGSDLLVKLNVDGDGKLSFTVDADTTRYIDLNDPANPATAGDNAGKNPQGIVDQQGTARAPTCMNFVSRNVSVVDLDHRPGREGRSATADAAGARLARGGRAGRRGDVLLLARPLRPAGRRDGVHRRAAVAARAGRAARAATSRA